jgi:phospholipase/lecithinase/hemolysin
MHPLQFPTRAAACVLAFGLAASPAMAGAYSALYAFGDSLSDVGNAFVATGGQQPAPPYVDGRFSNGPIWVDDVTAALGLAPLQPSLLGGTDYAVGGAITGTTPAASPGPGDLPWQLGQFSAAHPAADPAALYTLWAGGNDLLRALATGNPAIGFGTAMAAAANVAGTVSDLAALGARNLLVVDVPDLGVTPTARALGPAAASDATLLSEIFDTDLKTDLQEVAATTPNLALHLLDTFGPMDDIVNNPATYGFTDVTDACWTGDTYGYADPGSLCAPTAAGQNDYLFWDSMHPTAHGQALIAAEALEVLPEPGSVLLLASSMLGLGLLRRRGAAPDPTRGRNPLDPMA